LATRDLHRHDDIDPGAHQFLGKIRSIEGLIVGEPRLQDEVLPLHVASITQCLPELLETKGLVKDGRN
jgi:hypothetical protein